MASNRAPFSSRTSKDKEPQFFIDTEVYSREKDLFVFYIMSFKLCRINSEVREIVSASLVFNIGHSPFSSNSKEMCNLVFDIGYCSVSRDSVW